MRLPGLFFAASILFAQTNPPNIVHAQLETRVLSGNLAAAMSAKAPTWFGYAVSSLASGHGSCCGENGVLQRCSLEENHRSTYSGKSSQTTVQLESLPTLALLFRVTGSGVEKLRAYPLSCQLDGGGLPFVWLTGVSPAESLSYLTDLATHQNSRELADAAVFAIAQHADKQADSILAGLTRSDHPEHLRKQAIFWLGASRGAAGLPVLQELVAHDADERIRDKAVFALSIDKQPGALETLIRTAHSDSSPHIRGQALFWLAQKAGVRAASAISNAIENDADTQVKRQAVFALSQLPKDEAVPRLIEIARTQKNAEVRKQAFFWLGQTNDPRALQFIEQVLTN